MHRIPLLPRLSIAWLCLALAACESAEDQIAPKTAGTAMAPNGQAVFRNNCIACHGAEGNLGLNGAKDLSRSVLPLEERIGIITKGKNLMTPFGAILSPAEIEAAAAYTLTLKKQ